MRAFRFRWRRCTIHTLNSGWVRRTDTDVRAAKIGSAIDLRAQVDPGSLPTRKEGFRHFVLINVLHTIFLQLSGATSISAIPIIES
jgi:hypothetical protein